MGFELEGTAQVTKLNTIIAGGDWDFLRAKCDCNEETEKNQGFHDFTIFWAEKLFLFFEFFTN